MAHENPTKASIQIKTQIETLINLGCGEGNSYTWREFGHVLSADHETLWELNKKVSKILFF